MILTYEWGWGEVQSQTVQWTLILITSLGDKGWWRDTLVVQTWRMRVLASSAPHT